jgi:hypothetical protein
MKNETKQTGVEWYHQQIVDRQNGNGDSRSIDEILQQAKEMEKKQIIQSVTFGQNNHTVMYSQDLVIANDYYNETYGGNK